MKRISLALSLLLVASVAGAATLKETFDKTFDAKPGSEFSLSNVNGSIRVTVWDQPQIRVTAEKQTKSGDEEAARAAMRELHIDVDQKPGSLSITTVHPRRNELGFLDVLFGNEVNTSVSYEVVMPRQMNASIETVNGRVRVTGLSGTVRVETTNGGVEMERCGGNVVVSTTNGSIRSELVQVAPAGVRMETTNGRIVLIVPSSVAAEIDAATTNGAIESELPVTLRSSSRNRLRGAVNGGGATLRLRTTNGGIEVRALGAKVSS